MIAGITAGESLLERIGADHDAALQVAISSPGGCGKTAILSAVAASYRGAGVPVTDAVALVDGPAPNGVVLVDDAHLLDSSVLDRIQPLVEATATRLFVAYRPWPERPAVTRLTSAIRQLGPAMVLNHLDRHEVERRVAALAHRPSPDLVDLLVEDAGGLPLLIDEVLASWPTAPAPNDEAATIPGEVVDRVRRVVDQLEPGPRAVLHAVALGADLEPNDVAHVLGIDPPAASEAIEATWATGFLRADGSVIPLIAATLLRSTAPQRTREVRTALLRVRHDHRRDAVSLARELARSGVHDDLVADVLTSAADRRLAQEPEEAFELYGAAVDAGASAATLALRRADSGARSGQFDQALQLIDPVLADPTSPDLTTGLDIAATVMAHRGLLGRAAELYGWLGPDRIGTGTEMATISLLATGQGVAARRLVTARTPAPTMVGGVRSLMADGVWQTVDSTASAALSTMMRATTLLESAERSVLLPDTPAALTALIAIHTGDLEVADSALRRAIDRDLGGQLAWSRHHLLLAWVAMLRGRYGHARELIDDVESRTEEADRSPRDDLFVRALQLGIARRTSDAQGLVVAWNTGRDALFRHPVDLFVLLPVGEFIVAAARLGVSERVTAHLADARRLLHDLGEPVVWSAALHWSGVQAAILNNRPADVEPHAAALVEAAHHSPFASALAGAGRAWLRVLANDIDPAKVQAAAGRLQNFGLAWDGSRLLGQAAAHSSDRRTATTLLQAARSLQDPSEHDREPQDSTHVDASAPTAARASAVLSRRELEVAELLLQQQSYREIGAQLYISSKTVEHHVARIKRRIGASARADLFAHLRVLLDDLDRP